MQEKHCFFCILFPVCFLLFFFIFHDIKNEKGEEEYRLWFSKNYNTKIPRCIFVKLNETEFGVINLTSRKLVDSTYYFEGNGKIKKIDAKDIVTIKAPIVWSFFKAGINGDAETNYSKSVLGCRDHIILRNKLRFNQSHTI